MNLLISAPSGYNSREILLPLHHLLEDNEDVEKVIVLTPAAEHSQKLFPSFSDKFVFTANPATLAEHKSILRDHNVTSVLTPTVGLDVLDINILRAAKQIGIPAITFIASWDNVFKIERLIKKGHSGTAKYAGGDHEIPDFIAVWNQMNYDHILKIWPDFNAKNMEITGPPRFDYYTHEDKIPSRESVLNYIGAEVTDKPLIHVATTELYPSDYIVKSIKSLGQIYASVHPGGNMANHASLKDMGAIVKYSFGRRDDTPHPDFKYVPTEKETYMLAGLFKHTDVLVNHSSTVAIESFAADVPVVNVKYGRPRDWWHWYRSMVYRDFKQHYKYITEENATTIVKTEKELLRSVQDYLESPTKKQQNRAQTLTKMITHTDGGNSQRLLNFVKRCAA